MPPEDDWSAHFEPTSAPQDPDLLPEVLARMDLQARRRQLPIVDAIRGGLPPDVVTARLVTSGIRAHPDLISWWSWHDGVEDSYQGRGDYQLGTWVYSLDFAITEWLDFQEEIELDDDRFIFGVPPQYVPFMGGMAGDRFLLDTITREVAASHPQYTHDAWPRWPNMATLLNQGVANIACGEGSPPDSPGIHTPDPDYRSDNGS